MNNIKNKNLRFYLDNSTHEKAWDYLQKIDKTLIGSCNNVIVTAIVDYFENQEREKRFVKRLFELISDSSMRLNPYLTTNSQLELNAPIQTSAEEDVNQYIDFDFIGG